MVPKAAMGKPRSRRSAEEEAESVRGAAGRCPEACSLRPHRVSEVSAQKQILSSEVWLLHFLLPSLISCRENIKQSRLWDVTKPLMDGWQLEGASVFLTCFCLVCFNPPELHHPAFLFLFFHSVCKHRGVREGELTRTLYRFRSACVRLRLWAKCEMKFTSLQSRWNDSSSWAWSDKIKTNEETRSACTNWFKGIWRIEELLFFSPCHTLRCLLNVPWLCIGLQICSA